MDLTSLAQTLLKSGASVLGGALGGPAGAALAPAIIGALADALGLGKDATPQAIDAAIKADPAAAAEAVKRVEAQHAAAVMDELNARLAAVHNARQQTMQLAQSGSSIAWGAPVVSIIITLGFVVVLAAIFFKSLPDNQVVSMMIGCLVSEFRGVTAYWLGSSQGSRTKDELMASLASARSSAGAVVDAVAKTVKGRR